MSRGQVKMTILQHSAKYKVSHRLDTDFCSKSFPDDVIFAYGVLTGGCCCPLNITMFFKLMLERESPENLLRFVMCRQLRMMPPGQLEGIVWDAACRLDEYVLNREAREFEYVRLLVDGMHFKSHKKQKKPTGRKGRTFRAGLDKNKGGHNGCSDGFDFNQYKPFLPHGFNSQGREQMHIKLKKMTENLRQMSYPNYMNFLRVWFGLQNLKNRGVY